MAGAGNDDGLRHLEPSHVVQRPVGLIQAVPPADHLGERQPAAILLQQPQRTHHVPESRAPLAPYVGMLSVDVAMGIDARVTDIGVVPSDHVRSSVA